MTRKHSRSRSRILTHKEVARGYREIRLGHRGDLVPTPLPGQFCTVLPRRYPNPLLRRPFAYSDVKPSEFSFIYEIRGPATRDLSELTVGDEVDWIGPLGSWFPRAPEGKRPILVAGGIGVGPILFLADRFGRAEKRPLKRPLMILGARNRGLLPDLHWHPDVELRFCTDDGSGGVHGTVIDAIRREDLENAAFYSCGPNPMMAAVHRLAQENGCPCWVSVEEIMACGVGACQGCSVPTTPPDGASGPVYKRACVEGPIFESREILWPD